jgi:hypothetical protein
MLPNRSFLSVIEPVNVFEGFRNAGAGRKEKRTLTATAFVHDVSDLPERDAGADTCDET